MKGPGQGRRAGQGAEQAKTGKDLPERTKPSKPGTRSDFQTGSVPEPKSDLHGKRSVGGSVDAAGPMLIDLTLIDEDPAQPRTSTNPGFTQQSLQELAATIAERGVKSPISVRSNPQAPGRYLVNHGARRLRASRLAGKTTIAAFIDEDYNEIDQVIENLQRNELTAREVADFIGRQLARGVRKAEIARAIGKSPAFVTQHANLLDLPAPLASAFATGRSRDVTVINELLIAYRKNPAEVTTWLEDDSQELTRSVVKLLREYLENKEDVHQVVQGRSDNPEGAELIQSDVQTDQLHGELLEEGQTVYGDADSTSSSERRRTVNQPIIQVLHKGRKAELLIQRRPPAKGWGWVRFQEDGRVSKVELSQLRLLALIPG